MYHIVFDLEMTCWMSKIFQNPDGTLYVNDGNIKMPLNKQFQEVIEIGAVKLDDNLDVIDKYQRFVKPTINPQLTGWCRHITHIQQSDIEKAKQFRKNINDFYTWIASTGTDYRLYSWGKDDKIQIQRECELKRVNCHILKALEHNHYDLQRKFSFLNGRDSHHPIGLTSAANMLGSTFQNAHRALADSEATAQILIEMITLWRDRCKIA